MDACPRAQVARGATPRHGDGPVSGTHVAFIRLAVAYLVLTGVLGTAMIWNPAWTGYLRVAHFHAGLMGFFLSFVMGVAYWLLPRPGGRRYPVRERITLWASHGERRKGSNLPNWVLASAKGSINGQIPIANGTWPNPITHWSLQRRSVQPA